MTDDAQKKSAGSATPADEPQDSSGDHTPIPPPAPGMLDHEPADHTPIPPAVPDQRESIENFAAVAEEDKAAREAANIPRATASPTSSGKAADKPIDEAAAHEPTDQAAANQPTDKAATDKGATDKAHGEDAHKADADGEATANVPPIRAPDAWDGIGAWLVKHGALPALGILTVAIAIIHGRIFLGESGGDDLTFHYAESARIADCLAQGDFDFWNPSANGGYASLYYYQAIPQLASAIPAAIFGNHLFWFQLSVVLPLILAPACAYKGMRLLGATPWQALAAAFCVGFMNGASRWGSGNAGTFVVGLYTQTWALCAFPLALGYAAKWVTQGTHLASAIAWGGFVFLCHPFGGISFGFAVAMAFFAKAVLRFVIDPLLRLIGQRVRNPFLAKRWRPYRKRLLTPELIRSAILAVPFAITALPILLPLLIDGEGFGGFPHRVSDEVGPGFGGLWKWYFGAELLDYINKGMGTRIPVLTIAVPVVLVLARAKFFRWIWGPVVLFVLMLGLGPKLGKIGDDLIPPVRFLGAMQTLLAMGVGAGVIIIGQNIWKAIAAYPRWAYAVRTALAAAVAALTVLVAVPGARALGARVRTFGASDAKRHELVTIAKRLAELPQGRKQSGPGAENHWYNMLPYAWERVPLTLQMGGGGLQASPNYDFLWTQRDHMRTAWIFDAPYLIFLSSRGTGKVPNGVTELKTDNFELRRLPAPGLVSPVTVTGVLPPGYRHDGIGHKKALEWIKSDAPMKDEVLAYQGSGSPSERPQGRTLRAWRQDSPGSDADIVAEVEAQAPTTFMIRESWHPRWHAYVDGNEVPVRRVTPDFPAVDVGPGKHTIELRFERPLWAHLAWLAWPLPPLVAWFVLRRRRRTRPSPPLNTEPDLPLGETAATEGEPLSAEDLGLRDIVFGALLVIAGLIVTGVTYNLAAPGGAYLIATGPILAGAYLILRGLTRGSDRR